jgi:archaellum component FlaG (FlaF/FlaG flagellin family)
VSISGGICLASEMTEMIYTVALIIAAATIANTYFQNTTQLNNILNVASQNAKDASMTSLKTVFATKVSDNVIEVWVKNIGIGAIDYRLISKFDVFFGPKGSYEYIPYNKTSTPKWNFTILNDSKNLLRSGDTLDIMIYLDYSLTSGDYYFKIVAHNGVSSDYLFSL